MSLNNRLSLPFCRGAFFTEEPPTYMGCPYVGAQPSARPGLSLSSCRGAFFTEEPPISFFLLFAKVPFSLKSHLSLSVCGGAIFTEEPPISFFLLRCLFVTEEPPFFHRRDFPICHRSLSPFFTEEPISFYSPNVLSPFFTEEPV